ncbi:hypothetical protein ES705_11556 [subsurface metagenome]
MIKDNVYEEPISHFIKELEIPNFSISLQNSDFEKLEKAHNSIHEFVYIPPHIVNSEDEFDRNSAFFFYQNETFIQLHRSFLEAISGCYNAAYTLLRNSFEMLIKGAFWNCIAHKKYRDKAEIIKKITKNIDGTKESFISLFNETIRQKPKMGVEFEKKSVVIIEAISPILKDDKFRKFIPKEKAIIEQLEDWKMFDPIQEYRDPTEYVHNKFYSRLSRDVHVHPDTTDIWKRIFAKKEIFENEVIPEELNKYIEILHELMDLGIVIELNILENIITSNEHSRRWLIDRTPDVMLLGLNYASTKMAEMTHKIRDSASKH